MRDFTYEEQGDKRYLVYAKKGDDKLDSFTMEMLSNNTINGLAPFSCIQIDDVVYMKYNITGLISLTEYFSKLVKRQSFLTILEGLADSILLADDYMLAVSAYIFDESYIYINPESLAVSMVVLPIIHEERSPSEFFRKLLFDVSYDQTEDCTYIASLINLLRDDKGFSLYTFKEQVSNFKKTENYYTGTKTEKANSIHESLVPGNISHGKNIQKKTGNFDVSQNDKEKEERQEWLNIIFSGEHEETEKKKKGFFSKKEGKKEKKEKKSKLFFGRKAEKEEVELSTGFQAGTPLEGVAIPGMDFIDWKQNTIGGKAVLDKSESEKFQGQHVSVPAQDVKIQQIDAEQQDFGETVYLEEDPEDTILIDPEIEQPRKKFMLYRYSTKETFELKGDVIRIGRSPSVSEVCISGNRGVGRIHAILYVRDEQVFIADNDSKNKTFVNGEQIKSGDAPKLLQSGAKIRLGDEELEFRISG